MHPWDERWNKYEENVALRVAKKNNLNIDRKVLRAMIDAIDNWREKNSEPDSYAEEMFLARMRAIQEERSRECYSIPAELDGFRQPPAEAGEEQ